MKSNGRHIEGVLLIFLTGIGSSVLDCFQFDLTFMLFLTNINQQIYIGLLRFFNFAKIKNHS